MKLKRKNIKIACITLCLSIIPFNINTKASTSENINIEWINGFGGSSYYDSLQDIIQTSDKEFIAVGYSSSIDADFINKGGQDAIIIKYSEDCTQKWIKNFGGSGSDTFDKVLEASDGGFVCVGSTSSDGLGVTIEGSSDAIIIKYDKDWNQEWIQSMGTLYYDSFSDVIETNEGDFVVIDSDGYTGNHLVVKYDKYGNIVWKKSHRISSSENPFKGYPSSIMKDSEGDGFIITGSTHLTNDSSSSEAIIAKLDVNGDMVWYDVAEDSWTDFSSSIEIDGGYLAIGSGYGTNYIAKYNKLGNQEWLNKDSGAYYSKSGVAIQEGFITIDTQHSDVKKYNKSGNIEWHETIGVKTETYFNSIIKINDNELVIVGKSTSTNMGFINKGGQDGIILKVKLKTQAELKVEQAEVLKDIFVIENARNLVNQLPEGSLKQELQDRLNAINPELELERKSDTSNIDVYIKSENILQMSLDTNSITFEDFSGVEDTLLSNAINVSVNSSLPYSLNAYLPTEIQNNDKTNTMDKSILNIKENTEGTYKSFNNINEKVVLKDNNPAGNDLSHGIDFKLNGNIAHKKDVYKTTIKFEVEQK